MSKLWKIDIDEVEDTIVDLKDALELLDEFKNKYRNLVTAIVEENSGMFIDSIDINAKEEIDLIEEVVKSGSTIVEGSEKYLEKIEEINPWTGSGIYEVDENQVRNAIKDTKALFEQELEGNTRHIERDMDEMDRNITKFNHVDSTINEEREYEDDESTISHIRNRRSEIEKDIRDYKSNVDLLEEANDVLKVLEETLDDLI